MGRCLIKFNSLYRYFFLFGLGIVFSISVLAQKTEQIEIIQGEELIYTEREGVKAQRLVGDVIFKHQDALMFCDSAYRFPEANTIEAFGSVRINQGDTLNLYGDYLTYDGNLRLATVEGKEVHLINSDFDLETDRIVFDRKRNTAQYTTGGVIESQNDSNVLVSIRGFYFVDSKLFAFREDVKLSNPDFVMVSDTLMYYSNTEMVIFLGPTTIKGDSNLIYCENGWYDTKKDKSQYYENSYLISDGRKLEGDTLYYDRNLSYGSAIGNIQITDTAEQMTILGQKGRIFELQDSAIVTDQCLLIQNIDGDSLYMHADTFKVYALEENQRFMLAYPGVKIFKSDLQAVCDSMAYTLTDSTIRLFDDPILWSGEDQITADSIEIRTKNNKINDIFMYPNAFMISRIDSLRFNQVKGRTMQAFFKNSEIKRIEVKGNGQITHYALDDKEKFIGVSVAESSDITIRVNKEGIQSITLIGDAKAPTYPMGDLDPVTELRYKGFRWLIERRPMNKEAVLD